VQIKSGYTKNEHKKRSIRVSPAGGEGGLAMRGFAASRAERAEEDEEGEYIYIYMYIYIWENMGPSASETNQTLYLGKRLDVACYFEKPLTV
jgi:hypothetical protein